MLFFEELGSAEEHIKALDKADGRVNSVKSAEIAIILEGAAGLHRIDNDGAADGKSEIVAVASGGEDERPAGDIPAIEGNRRIGGGFADSGINGNIAGDRENDSGADRDGDGTSKGEIAMDKDDIVLPSREGIAVEGHIGGSQIDVVGKARIKRAGSKRAAAADGGEIGRSNACSLGFGQKDRVSGFRGGTGREDFRVGEAAHLLIGG